jgi:hypothetical protein
MTYGITIKKLTHGAKSKSLAIPSESAVGTRALLSALFFTFLVGERTTGKC